MVGLLIEAGPEGLTTVEITDAFGIPAPRQQRSNRVSQIARKMFGRGYAEHMGRERSPLYRHNYVNRWRVTEEGAAWYRGELARVRRQVTEDGLWRIRIREAAQAREAALAAARGELADLIREGGTRAVTKQRRQDMILRLRAVPCTLGEIGDVFGITRERVRLIEMKAREEASLAELRAASGLPALGA